MHTVFLSYRQKDTPGFVSALFDRLSQRFGAGSVFWDGRSVREGENYEVAMLDAVRASRVVLVVIGPHWLATDERGIPRLEDPLDPVRLEIEAALEAGCQILPVLIAGATMPSRLQVPGTIAAICTMNAAELNPGRSFSSELVRLVSLIEERMAPRRKTLGTPTPTPWNLLGLIGGAHDGPGGATTELVRAVAVGVVKRGLGLATVEDGGPGIVARAAASTYLSSQGVDPTPYLPRLSSAFKATWAPPPGGIATGEAPIRVAILIGGSVDALAMSTAARAQGVAVLPVPSTGEAPFVAWRRMYHALPAELAGALTAPEFLRLADRVAPDIMATVVTDLAERVLASGQRKTGR